MKNYTYYYSNGEKITVPTDDATYEVLLELDRKESIADGVPPATRYSVARYIVPIAVKFMAARCTIQIHLIAILPSVAITNTTMTSAKPPP